MKAKLTSREREEVQVVLANLANNAIVTADKLDPNRECKVRDGERYVIARHLDAIHRLAKETGAKLAEMGG